MIKACIFDSVSNLRIKLVQEISNKIRRNADEEQFTKFLFEGHHLADELLVGNITDGISDIQIFVVEKNSPAYPRVNNVNIFMRNVQECIICAKDDINPR